MVAQLSSAGTGHSVPVASKNSQPRPKPSGHPGHPNRPSHPNHSSHSNHPNHPNQTLVRILYVLSGLAILLLVAVTVVTFIPKGSSDQTADQTRIANPAISSVGSEKKPLSELSKDEAVSYLTNAYANNVIPEGLLDPRLAELFKGQYVSLEYSYDGEPDFNDGLVSSYGKYKTKILPIDSTFAVYYAVDENGEIIPNGFLDLAFDKSFLNYRLETTTETDADGDTSTSGNDVTTFTNLGDSFLEKALPLVSIALHNKSFNGIYDYEFERTDHALIFRTYNISVGIDFYASVEGYSLDPTDPDGIPYAINLFTTEASVDLDTGNFDWLYADDGSVSHTIKSYPVKGSEISELLSYVTQSNAH